MLVQKRVSFNLILQVFQVYHDSCLLSVHQLNERQRGRMKHCLCVCDRDREREPTRDGPPTQTPSSSQSKVDFYYNEVLYI